MHGVGAVVGDAVGDIVGEIVGCNVGDTEGLVVGDCVGLAVGQNCGHVSGQLVRSIFSAQNKSTLLPTTVARATAHNGHSSTHNGDESAAGLNVGHAFGADVASVCATPTLTASSQMRIHLC